MKITVGLDVTPLYSGHKIRGIGFYTKRLLESLKELKKETVIIRELKKGDVKKGKFDLLHIPYFSPFFITLPFKNKKPLIVTVHDLIRIKNPNHYPPGVKGKIRWQIQKKLLGRAERIITDSQASKKDIVRLIGFPEEKIAVVYLAADSRFGVIGDKRRLLKVKKKYNLPDKFVLYVGDIDWNKNVPGLVKACERLKVPLVIVGKQAVNKDFDHQHPENKDLIWLQKRINKGKLFAPGFVSTGDLVAIYNLANIYCQPSFDEGFGLPVLEAMSCGCPVVSSNKGSLPEVVGSAGILVDPDVDSLGLAIRHLFNDAFLREKLSRLGLKRAKEFSWHKTAEEVLSVYRTVLQKN